jgi:hypothetical protein
MLNITVSPIGLFRDAELKTAKQLCFQQLHLNFKQLITTNQPKFRLTAWQHIET